MPTRPGPKMPRRPAAGQTPGGDGQQPARAAVVDALRAKLTGGAMPAAVGMAGKGPVKRMPMPRS